MPDLIVTLLNQIPKPPVLGVEAVRDDAELADLLERRAVLRRASRAEIIWPPRPPSTKTSVSPTLAPLARGLKVVPLVNPGRLARKPVMSRLLPPTITGSSLTIFSDSAVVLVIAEESSSEADTATVSVTPEGLQDEVDADLDA